MELAANLVYEMIGVIWAVLFAAAVTGTFVVTMQKDEDPDGSKTVIALMGIMLFCYLVYVIVW